MNKEELEIEAIRQDIAHKKKTLILTIVGVVITVGSIGLERLSAYEQRNQQTLQAIKQQRITRMLEIVREYEQIFADTIAAVNEAKTNDIYLALALDALNEEISRNQELQSAAANFTKLSTDILSKLRKESKASAREYIAAIKLQSVWESKFNGFSPDIAYYFGDKSLVDSKTVAQLGWQAINEKYNIFSDGGGSIDGFKKIGSKLSADLRGKINSELNLPMK